MAAEPMTVSALRHQGMDMLRHEIDSLKMDKHIVINNLRMRVCPSCVYLSYPPWVYSSHLPYTHLECCKSQSTYSSISLSISLSLSRTSSRLRTGISVSAVFSHVQTYVFYRGHHSLPSQSGALTRVSAKRTGECHNLYTQDG